MRTQSHINQQNKLLCACTGTLCEDVCREQHLHRPRFANPIPKKGEIKKTQWAEKCPEAYEK